MPALQTKSPEGLPETIPVENVKHVGRLILINNTPSFQLSKGLKAKFQQHCCFLLCPREDHIMVFHLEKKISLKEIQNALQDNCKMRCRMSGEEIAVQEVPTEETLGDLVHALNKLVLQHVELT